eukprot:COSAG01_NODE_65_length_29252_cov_173.296995_31_plen_71_part_00
MEAACTKLTEAYGTIDILVNAAGGNQAGATIGPDQSFCSTFDTAAFDQVLQSFLSLSIVVEISRLSLCVH